MSKFWDSQNCKKKGQNCEIKTNVGLFEKSPQLKTSEAARAGSVHQKSVRKQSHPIQQIWTHPSLVANHLNTCSLIQRPHWILILQALRSNLLPRSVMCVIQSVFVLKWSQLPWLRIWFKSLYPIIHDSRLCYHSLLHAVSFLSSCSNTPEAHLHTWRNRCPADVKHRHPITDSFAPEMWLNCQ